MGNAIVGAYELLLKRDAPEYFQNLSRLFVYYNARLIEGSSGEDSGVYLRDGIKAVRRDGICTESLWPYDINHFATRPSAEAYEDAQSRNIKNYYRLTGIDQVLDALNNDRPAVLAIDVFDTFDYLNYINSILYMPGQSEINPGGHAVCAVGYDLARKMVLARNSFGTDWGDAGYFWIPFEYLEAHTLDQWVFDIELIK